MPQRKPSAFALKALVAELRAAHPREDAALTQARTQGMQSRKRKRAEAVQEEEETAEGE